MEMRAEMAAVRAQIVSRLGRLDKRVARMEWNRAQPPDLAAVRANGPSLGSGRARARRVVAPARRLKLDDLSSDLLALVAAALPEDDDLAAALSCRKLRAAVALGRFTDGRSGGSTSAASAFSSDAKLIWFVASGLPLSTRLCRLAAERGQLPQLSWLRSRGCPWSAWTCSNAARSGHPALLQWARANRCS